MAQPWQRDLVCGGVTRGHGTAEGLRDTARGRGNVTLGRGPGMEFGQGKVIVEVRGARLWGLGNARSPGSGTHGQSGVALP